jgi:hypothetical protein
MRSWLMHHTAACPPLFGLALAAIFVLRFENVRDIIQVA